MTLLQIIKGSVLFGQPPLLDDVDFDIKAKQRICIVGRNGSGKSTLMKVLAGEVKLDSGRLIKDTAVRVSLLPQDPPQKTDITIFDYVIEGLSEHAELLKAYHHQTQLIVQDPSDKHLNQLQTLQEKLEDNDAWSLEQTIQQLLTRFTLSAQAKLSSLSGGWRRKAALARAMVQSPDILLLDEPTNHLDIDTVKWLESTLLGLDTSIVLISHDRAFIRKVATSIVDIDRGKLTEYACNYDDYLVRKAHDLAVEEEHNRAFDKKLSQEETWIRQGIKARRTRNEGRVRALKSLRNEFKQRRNAQGSVEIKDNMSEASGKQVFKIKNLSYAINDKTIIQSFSSLINRSDKIGLIGPNGSGKSTFLKLLLGELQATTGTIKGGTQLDVVYFDQHRQQLPLDATVIDAVADGKQEIMINGKSRHVMSYLQDYLFSPDRVRVPVSALSGGEKNRLLLAKLLIKPNNLLIMDEPTNDLDVETLELLESLLVEYKGTLLVASHDREFLDNTVTRCLSFEKNGIIRQFVGGYTEVQEWYAKQQAAQPSVVNNSPVPTKVAKKREARAATKLSFNEERELKALPGMIEDLEQRLDALQNEVNTAGFFDQPRERSDEILATFTETEQALEQAFDKWQALEEKANKFKSQDV
ncbi:MAG: ATP-binding cassette domain-containing protein [Pseudomonadota bacterium]